jgi:hypothetical protein
MHRTVIVAASLLLLTLVAPDPLTADTPPYEIVEGCLELSPAGDFVLRGSAEDVTLQNAGGMEKHVGRTVRVTGRWQDGAGGRRLRVAKIEWIAEGCG